MFAGGGVRLDYMLKGEGGFGGKALGMTVAGWRVLEGMSSIEGVCRREGAVVQETPSFRNLTSSVPPQGQPFPLPAQLQTFHLAGPGMSSKAFQTLS